MKYLFKVMLIFSLLLTASLASEYADSVEKEISLKEGVNLVSFEGEVTIDSLVSKIGFSNLIYVRGKSTVYKKSYVKKGLSAKNSFKNTQLGQGYWIKLKKAITFSYEKKLKHTNVYTLKKGKNLIGPLSELTIDELIEQIGFKNLISIQGAGQGSAYKKSYVDNNLAFLNSLKGLEMGKGYSIKVKKETKITYNPRKTISLNKGFNLVSFKGELTLESLVSKIGFENLIDIKIEDTIYNKLYVDQKSSYKNSFKKTELGQGYWIQVKNNVTFSYDEKINYTKIYALKKGENLIGPLSELNIDELVGQIGFDNLIAIQGAGQGVTYKKLNVDNYMEFLNSLKVLKVGQGYWVTVENDTRITYE